MHSGVRNENEVHVPCDGFYTPYSGSRVQPLLVVNPLITATVEKDLDITNSEEATGSIVLLLVYSAPGS